jgi:cytochrome c peroxidase
VRKYLPSQSHRHAKRFLVGAMITATVALLTAAAIGKDRLFIRSFPNASGVLGTFSKDGPIDTSHPFFQPLGQQFATTCEHCHFASDAFGISADHAQELFYSTAGQHPLFSAPTANDFHAALVLGSGGTIEEREAAYSLILNKGDALVRRNLNPVRDFTVTAVVAPTLPASLHTICVDDNGKIVVDNNNNSSNVAPPCEEGSTPAIPGDDYLAYTAQDNLVNGTPTPQIWIHRRPLPTTNFEFLTTAAWDGQDTRQSPNPVVRPTSAGVFDIAKATIRGRQTGPSLIAPDGDVYTDAELDVLSQELTDFMFSLFAAQDRGHGAGSLSAKGATGGVVNLANQPFYFGINDVLQGDLMVAPDGTVILNNIPFTPIIFTEFNAWKQDYNPHRASIERGQALFNEQRLTISGVGGLNNATPTLPDGTILTPPLPSSFVGSCGTCHDSPNVGNHSTRLPIDIGISDKAPVGLGRAAVADLPLFILARNSDGAIAQTTDPGRAVISGQFAHIGQFKGPILHGMAARAPFFHNGMATTLEDVVTFYNARFDANFTPQEMADLVNFLKSL